MTPGTVKLTRKMASLAPASGTRLPARIGAFFGSPVILASSIVCLVAAVGIISTASTYRSLRRVGENHERASVAARSDGIRRSLSDAFAIADPLLARVTRVATRPDAATNVESLLATLSDVAFARHGLTWSSVSFPDGTFVGVHREPNGELIGKVSRVVDHHEIRYRFGPDGPVVRSEGPSTYDPRARSFYRIALAAARPVWTDPYPFLPDLHTGVTRAYAVRDSGALIAVITADFDATELAKLFAAPLTASERALVSVGDAVLATRGVPEPSAGRRTVDHALVVGDFDDPVLALAHRTRRPRVEHDGETYRLSRVRVASLDGRPIELLIAIPESELYERAVAEAKSGMLATAIVALLGLVFATLLSANVALLRRRREEAEEAAARARAEIEELGTYELGQKIGSGGMGEVYRARHRLLARDAAVKVIKASDDEDVDASIERFFQEARTLASLRSLHTVAVYDFGVAVDGRYFLAMELLSGLDLDALVRTHGAQPPARVATILAQICDSLAEAHASGVVHQDIKPANVFLCRLAESLDFVKVLDFGLTRAVGRRSGDGHGVEGTPAFMAPEQALGESLSYATDLYAVGCVGYFLLAARFPYSAVDSDAYMRAHVSLPVPTLPDAVRASTPAALVELLTRCLAKDPRQRPSSAAALATQLRRVARDSAATFPDTALRAFWDARTNAETDASDARSGTKPRALADPSEVARPKAG